MLTWIKYARASFLPNLIFLKPYLPIILQETMYKSCSFSLQSITVGPKQIEKLPYCSNLNSTRWMHGMVDTPQSSSNMVVFPLSNLLSEFGTLKNHEENKFLFAFQCILTKKSIVTLDFKFLSTLVTLIWKIK